MDQGFLLAMPIFGDCMHNLCSQLQQHHPWLLTSKSKRFAQGPTLSRAFSVLLMELINYVSQAGDTSPLTNVMDVQGTYIKWPLGIWRRLL